MTKGKQEETMNKPIDRGLNPQEVKELVDYIAKNNSWEHMYTLSQDGRKVVKYYNMTVDTRTNTVWRVEFDEISECKDDKVVFRTENGYNLKTAIYSWLDEVKQR